MKCQQTKLLFVCVGLVVIVLLTLQLINGERPQSSSSPSPQNIPKNIDIKTDLPLTPEKINPTFNNQQSIKLTDAKSLTHYFDSVDYHLAKVRLNAKVPNIQAINLPIGLAKVSTANKVNDFIQIMLPIILNVNLQLTQVRQQLLTIADSSPENLTNENKVWLDSLIKHYQASDIQSLINKVDTLPVSLILAQAIDESGWGTSYFAINGNALYGEHLPATDKHFLSTPTGKVKVAAFTSLSQATAAYLFNINTSSAYKKLRVMRQQMRHEKRPLNGTILAATLIDYSTRGQAYVEDLVDIMMEHQLTDFDTSQLNMNMQPIQLDFSR